MEALLGVFTRFSASKCGGMMVIVLVTDGTVVWSLFVTFKDFLERVIGF